MALPRIKTPIYKQYLTGLQKEVEYRPFTVAEQKILLLAKEEAKDNPERMLDSVMQIISNCTMNKIDVERLPAFDVIELITRIRAKSVGEVITKGLSESYVDDEGIKRQNIIKFNINLDEIKMVVPEGHTNKIVLDEESGVGVIMRYPTFKDAKEQKGNQLDQVFSLISHVFDKEQVYDVSTETKEELTNFIDSIGALASLKIQKQFLDTMPRFEHRVTVKLKNGDPHEIVLKDFDDFFTS